MTPIANKIISDVERETGIPKMLILARDKTEKYAFARQDVWYRLRVHNQVMYSYPKLAAMFDRHHTTIMHGVNRHIERSKR